VTTTYTGSTEARALDDAHARIATTSANETLLSRIETPGSLLVKTRSERFSPGPSTSETGR
jgi:hypothetical protein